jgi:hypothetical protein
MPLPSRSLALAALLFLPACSAAQEDELIGSDEEDSTAIINFEDEEGRLRRWPDGKVTYYIDDQGILGSFYCGKSDDGDKPAGEPFSPDDLDNINTAIARWDDFTPLDFVPSTMTADAPPTLIITRSNAGGHTFDAKPNQPPAWMCIVVPTGVKTTGIAHELGHAIGLIHEHQRPDRNEFITVDRTCIRPGDRPSYKRAKAANVVELGPYDYDSIMHYTGKGESECCSEGDKTTDPDTGEITWECPNKCRSDAGECTIFAITRPCEVPGPDCEFIPPYKDVSPGDVNTVFRMYERPLGNDEIGDRMGAAMVHADFDNDGYLDLAVGAPDERTNVDGVETQTGAVFMFRGTASRLTAWKVLRSRRPTSGGRFGAALATGDLDGDGTADLAVGAPGEQSRTDDAIRGGNVYLFQTIRVDRMDGKAGKSSHFGLGFWKLYDAADAGARAEAAAEFGSVIHIADLTADGRKDLIIGAPAGALATPPDIFNAIRSGYVAILSGRPDDPTGALPDHPVPWARVLRPGSAPQRTGERFGESLGTFMKDGLRWLVVGAPEAGLPSARGAAYTFAPFSSSMIPVDELRISTGPTRFGAAIATGKYGPTMNRTFVAIGAPQADQQRGQIHVFRVGGTSLVSAQVLTVPPSAPPDHVGEHLTVIDATGGLDHLFAGLPLHDVAGVPHVGAVRTWFANFNTTTPLASAGITENLVNDTAPHDHFGSSIAMTGRYDFDTGAVVGHSLVWGADGLRNGGAFVVSGTTRGEFRVFDQKSADPQ